MSFVNLKEHLLRREVRPEVQARIDAHNQRAMDLIIAMARQPVKTTRDKRHVVLVADALRQHRDGS